MKPRKYQIEALQSIKKEFDRGIKRTLLIQATGTGKTIILNGIAFSFAYNSDRTPTGKRVLVLAHQNILLDQAAEKFKMAVSVDVTREKGTQTCIDSDLPIVVASVQTMQRRLEKFPSNYFDLIIVDEAHHSASKQYQEVLNYFKDAKVLGVTATPDRADKKSLNFFESVAYHYSIEDGQRDGYLVPVRLEQTPVEIDISKVKKKKGDFDERSLGEVIEDYLDDIAQQVRKLALGRKIICFVPLITTAESAADVFSKYGFNAISVSGQDSKERREEILKGFESGRYDIVCNAMLLTEGYDCPQVDCVIVLRPTTSRALYVQMVGRGLRLAPGKKDCLLIDFLFQHEDFNLVGPTDVFKSLKTSNKNNYHNEFSHGAPQKNPLMEDAETRLIKKLKEAAERHAKLVKAQTYYPNVEEITRQQNEISGLEESPMAEWQEDRLIEAGIDPTGLTYGMAENVLEKLKQEAIYKKNQGKPTSRQAWRLRKLGISEDVLKTMTFGQAKAELSRQKAMGRW